MNILFLASELKKGYGGIKNFNCNFLEVLLNQRHRVVVVSLNDREKYINPYVISFPVGSIIGFLSKFLFVFYSFYSVINCKPKLIVCGHIDFIPVAQILNYLFSIPFVCIVHGVEIKFLKKIEKRCLIKAKSILAASRFTRDCILKVVPGYPNEKIFVVGNTFDDKKFSPSPRPEYLLRRLSLQKDDLVIMTVSRLDNREQYKGHDKVLMVLKEIHQDFPSLHYIIVGSGDDLPRIKALAKKLKIENKVIFCNSVSDEELPDYYSLCDVFVMPSSYEGFGIVFLEALSSGKPVVAGIKDGSADPLLDGQLGYLVDPDDLEALKNVIIKILKKDIPPNLLNPFFLHNVAKEKFGKKAFERKVTQALSSLDLVKQGFYNREK